MRSMALGRRSLPCSVARGLAAVAMVAIGCSSTIGDGSRAHADPLPLDLASIDSVIPGQPVLVTGRVRIPAGPLDCPLNEGCWIGLQTPDDAARSYPWYVPMAFLDGRRGKGVVVRDDRGRVVADGTLAVVRAVVTVRSDRGRSLEWTTSVRRAKDVGTVSP